MARLPRLVIPHQPHHIIQRGNDNQRIFRDSEDYERFLGWLKDAARDYHVAIHAYVLLPGYLQLLATPQDTTGLAQAMQRVGRYYVPWFNQKYGRSGTLFQGRFKTAVIDAERYLLPCSLYIESDPVRAQLAPDPLSYAWSSHPHHVGACVDPLITDHARYWALGNTPFQREAAYREASERGLSSREHEAIEAAVLKGWPLGSDHFKTQLQHTAQRQVLPARRGRPPKAKPPAA